MDQLKYWLALHHAPFLGPMKTKAILEVFPTPEDFFLNLSDVVKTTKFHEKTKSALQNPDWARIELELEWASANDNHIIHLHDASYPKLLKEIPDPATVLYIQGNVALLDSAQIAIVGSRNPSHTGRDNAYQFAKYLSDQGITVTSGLALGIDYESHRGALSAHKSNTIAVIATGVDRVYPARHKSMVHEIVEKSGAIVSEYPLGTAPRKEYFPRRNRIISGLSLGTLVVEAAQKSGSLITARQAAEQGREVFAIPSSIQNPLAKGCHQLIREGAKLVETAQHILEELTQLKQTLPVANNRNLAFDFGDKLGQDYQQILDCIGYEPTTIDEIVVRSRLTPESVSSMLLVLELQDYIKSQAGSIYSRTQ